jgi:hypothetical protein
MADGILTRRGGGSSIKSVQTILVPGMNSTPVLTINEVDPDYSIILAGNTLISYYLGGPGVMNGVSFSSSTEITINAPRIRSSMLIIIEFEPSAVKSNQRGIYSATNSPEVVTINEVDLSKCIMSCFASTGDNDDNPIVGGITAFTPTSISIMHGYSTTSRRPISWQVLELK